MFNKIKDIKAVRTQILNLRKVEATTIKSLNDITPMIIGGVIAGDNVAIVNQLLAALRGSRKREITAFVKAFLPHEFKKDTETFGKRLKSEKQVEAKVADLEAFLESEQTVFDWIESRHTTEDKPEVDYKLKVRRSIGQAMKKGGLTAEDILSILQEVVADEAAADEPKVAVIKPAKAA